MSTAVSPPSTASPDRDVSPSFDQRIVIPGLTWEQYVAITDALPDRPGIRTAFDGENLELMTTSSERERVKRILNSLIEIMRLEFNIDLLGGGITTFRSEALKRGLEPDECYWIAHVKDVIGLDRWEAGVHPPPDLAIEVDISSKSISRQPIYAKLGVPEIWRYDGQSLTALTLNEDGTYSPIEKSRSFPFLTVAHLQPFVEASKVESESTVVRNFLDWLREQDFAV